MANFWLSFVLLILVLLQWKVYGMDTNSTQKVSCSMKIGDEVIIWGECRILPRFKSSFCRFTYPESKRNLKETEDCPLKNPRNPQEYTKNGIPCRGRHLAVEGETGVCACVNGTQACLGETYFRLHHPLCTSKGVICTPTSSTKPLRAFNPWLILMSFSLTTSCLSLYI